MLLLLPSRVFRCEPQVGRILACAGHPGNATAARLEGEPHLRRSGNREALREGDLSAGGAVWVRAIGDGDSIQAALPPIGIRRRGWRKGKGNGGARHKAIDARRRGLDATDERSPDARCGVIPLQLDDGAGRAPIERVEVAFPCVRYGHANGGGERVRRAVSREPQVASGSRRCGIGRESPYLSATSRYQREQEAQRRRGKPSTNNRPRCPLHRDTFLRTGPSAPLRDTGIIDDAHSRANRQYSCVKRRGSRWYTYWERVGA